MAELSATQIPKPANEQAFEHANEILWRCILNDESVKTYARRGQKQDGVDLTGIRDNNPEKIVGIQAKLKGDGKELEEGEVRDEVDKALKFDPPLSEYIIVTTAPDSGSLDSLVLTLSQSCSKGREIPLKIRVMGWGSLEREIRRHVDAIKAFDPSHTPHGDLLLQQMKHLPSGIVEAFAPQMVTLHSKLDQVIAINAGDIEESDDRFLSAIEREIDGYAHLLSSSPFATLDLLQKLNDSLDKSASGRIRFRVAANIAACKFELGEDVVAAEGFISAFDFDPTNPKAAANKALGLLIKGDLNNLKEFATAKLTETPDNAPLAGYFIQGLSSDKNIDDPLALIPDGVKNSPDVALAHIRWQMEQGDENAWWEHAEKAYIAHPDVSLIAEHHANALLEKVLKQTGFRLGRELTATEAVDVKESIRIYQEAWTRICDPAVHTRGAPVSVPLNLMIAYRLMHRGDDAVKIGQEALEKFSGTPDIMERTAAALMENGEQSHAKDLIDKLEMNRETVMMRFHLFMGANDWDAIDDLITNHMELFPEFERGVANAAHTLANIERAAPKERQGILESRKGHLEGDARANMIFAHAARVNGLEGLADHFFKVGIKALNNTDTSFAERMTVANEAVNRNDPGTAARVLSGHVALDRDSAELRLLAQTIAHDFPIRDRAARFFESLSPEVRALPTYQVIEGTYHLNRDAPHDAVNLFTSAFESDPEIVSLMGLIGAYLRTENKDAIKTLLQDEKLDYLTGSSIDKMNYCHVLLDCGEPVRALNTGYEALIEGLDRSDVVMKFCGLLLMPSTHQRIPDDLSVSTGIWVRMTTQNGSDYSAIIGESTDRPWGAAVDPSNTFIAKALGLNVGDSFENETSLGTKETWTITEIKPVWLQAFHFLSNTFAQRFPNARGFASITMKDEDIEPVLEQIRIHSEAVRERANLYLVNELPMAIVAGSQVGGAIGFADYLVEIGEHVRTCFGSAEERIEALEIIEKNAKAGAVLDALTAWRAAELDIFSILEERLGPLALPSIEFDLISRLIKEQDDRDEGERVSLTYLNGQFVRTIATSEEVAANLKLLQNRLEVIKNGCSIEPVIIPDELPELGEALLTLPSGDAIAPAVLAGHERLLLSEDMMMRRITNDVFGVKGIWLQSVLLSALDAETMTAEAYSDALVILSAHRHDFVSVGSIQLVSVFERDTSDDLVRVQALCEYIGSKRAEPRSHIGLVADFVNTIWTNSVVSDLRIRKATSIVWRSLLARNRGTNWAKWAGALLPRLNPDARDFFYHWCRGHFLPVKEIETQLRRVRNSRPN